MKPVLWNWQGGDMYALKDIICSSVQTEHCVSGSNLLEPFWGEGECVEQAGMEGMRFYHPHHF